MSVEIILFGLLIVSVLTGLTTEAIKIQLDEYGKTYHANMLAGGVSVILSLAVGIAYTIIAGIDVNAQLIVCLVALVFLSWLCSMVGYDKVIQTLAQLKSVSSEKEE